MLSREAAELLVSLLSNDSDPLSSISSRFSSNFDVNDKMVALAGISMLLSDCLLDHPQQIVALWILVNEFEDIPIIDSPFLPVFLYLFDMRNTNPNACPPQMYDILLCLLGNCNIEIIAESTVKTILSPTFQLQTPSSPSIALPKQYQARTSPLLTERAENTSHTMSQSQILVELLCDPTIYNDFEPPYIRPLPDVSPIFPGELQQSFISSFDASPPLYDECVSIDSKEAATVLIHRATDNKLKGTEIESLVHEIQKNPEIATEVGLPCEKLVQMIEMNPLLAKELYCVLIPKEGDKFFESLCHIQITPSLVEVAKSIFCMSDLPPNYLNDFISGHIKTISNVKDPQVSNKKTALFCGLLCQLFDEGIRYKDDLLMDLYSFCLEPKNESIHEAQDLATRLSD